MEKFDRSSIKSLNEFEEILIGIFKIALKRLVVLKNFTNNEDKINNLLALEVRKERSQLNPYTIRYKLPIQPSGFKTEISDGKIPEMTWEINDYIDPPSRYDIECKRLYFPKSSSCSDYVDKGVKRFVTNTHCYSNNFDRGLMIGYVIDLEHSVAFESVNMYAKNQFFPELIIADGWHINDISHLNQTFIDREFEPKPFYLRHLWVDFREKFTARPKTS